MQKKILTTEHPGWMKYIDTLSYILKAHRVPFNPICMPHDLEITMQYLDDLPEIDVEKSLEYIKSNFGECDCEILKKASYSMMPVFTKLEQSGTTIKEFVSEAIATFIEEDDVKLLSLDNPMGLALNTICGRCEQPAKIIEIRITPHIIESKYQCFNCLTDWHLEYNTRIGMGSIDCGRPSKIRDLKKAYQQKEAVRRLDL